MLDAAKDLSGTEVHVPLGQIISMLKSPDLNLIDNPWKGLEIAVHRCAPSSLSQS